MPARAGGIAREDAAHRGAVGTRGVERQPLAALAQPGLQRAERDPGLHGRGEIGRLVLEDPVEPPEPQHEADAARRQADAELGAPAPGRHRDPLLGGQREDRPDLFLAAGEDHGLGRAALEHVGRALDAAEHMGGPDEAPELVEQACVQSRRLSKKPLPER